MTLNKVMLWGVTVLTIAFLSFPNYVGTLVGGGDRATVTDNMNRAVIKIEGMTCEACAVNLRAALSKLDGLHQADVSFADKRAVLEIKFTDTFPNWARDMVQALNLMSVLNPRIRW